MRSAWDLESDHDQDWRLNASCRGHDPELWTLLHPRGAEYRLAHRICHECPVRADCLKLATRIGAVGMIFGGVDFPESRKAMVHKWTP